MTQLLGVCLAKKTNGNGKKGIEQQEKVGFSTKRPKHNRHAQFLGLHNVIIGSANLIYALVVGVTCVNGLHGYVHYSHQYTHYPSSKRRKK